MTDLVQLTGNSSEKAFGTGFRKFLNKLSRMFSSRKKKVIQVKDNAAGPGRRPSTINLTAIPVTPAAAAADTVQEVTQSSDAANPTAAAAPSGAALETPSAAAAEQESGLSDQTILVPQNSKPRAGGELQNVETSRQMLTESLLSALKRGREHQTLLVPPKLLSKVTESVLNAAKNEPSGLRGCIIYLYYQKKSAGRRWSVVGRRRDKKAVTSAPSDDYEQIAEIVCDPGTVATFELSLVLQPETKLWRLPSWQLFKRGVSQVSYNFKLTKQKLYRSCSSSSFTDSLRAE